MTTEISVECLGCVNGSGQQQHGWSCQGRQRCWRSVVVGDSSGRQQQGSQGTEAADVSKGVIVWDGRRLGQQRKAFSCGSPGAWDGRSIGNGNPLVLVVPGQHGRRRRGWKRSGSSKGVVVSVVGGSEGVDGVWGNIGDGNGRRRRRTVSGSMCGRRQQGR